MTGKQGRILIADDEMIIRKLFHQKLSSEGYHCQSLADILTPCLRYKAIIPMFFV